jgi:hypothetical protein
MKVYIVWFEHWDSVDLVCIFSTEEGAKEYVKVNRTFGNEGLSWEEHEVEL